jgi:hypothetical protein
LSRDAGSRVSAHGFRPFAVIATAAAFAFGTGCGGSNAPEVAHNLEGAIHEAEASGENGNALEEQICAALERYNSSGQLIDSFQQAAASQAAPSGSGAPPVVTQLNDAADAIDNSQFASEVAGNLSC